MQFCIFNSSLFKEIEKNNSGEDEILIWNALYNWGWDREINFIWVIIK